MNENVLKMQYGCCRYCGESRMIEPLNPNASQEDIDLMATASCNCPGAAAERSKKTQMENVAAYARQLSEQLWPDEPGKGDELERIINASAHAVWGEGAEKVTIHVRSGRTITVYKARDSIKIKTSWKYESEIEF